MSKETWNDVPEEFDDEYTPSFDELVEKARKTIWAAMNNVAISENAYRSSLEILKLAQKGGALDAEGGADPSSGGGSPDDGLPGQMGLVDGNVLSGAGDRFKREIDRAAARRDSGDRED